MFNSGPRFLCPLTYKDTPLAHDIVHVFAMSRRNSHVEMCAAACGCMKHTWSNNGQTKERAERETGELQVTSKIKIMSTSMRIRVTPSFCHRLRQFTQMAPKNSKHFLPDGCKTLLRLTNTSRQQHLDQHWFPFLLYLEKHGSHAKRRHCNKVRLPLFITALLKCKGRKEESLGMKLMSKNKMASAKLKWTPQWHRETLFKSFKIQAASTKSSQVHGTLKVLKCWRLTRAKQHQIILMQLIYSSRYEQMLCFCCFIINITKSQISIINSVYHQS